MKLVRIEELLLEDKFKLIESNKLGLLNRDCENLWINKFQWEDSSVNEFIARNMGGKCSFLTYYTGLLLTRQTSSVFLHRYWLNCMLEDKQSNNHVLALASLYLACKVKNATKDVTLFIKAYRQIFNKNGLFGIIIRTK